MRKKVREEERETIMHMIKIRFYTLYSCDTNYLAYMLQLRKHSGMTNCGLGGHFTVIHPIFVHVKGS